MIREARFLKRSGMSSSDSRLARRVTGMNRDELEGRGEQIKGKIKQAAGDLTDNEELHGEGVADEAAGSVQEGYGKARRKAGEAIEDLGDKLKR
jgi:uncharacterized protein YjbJ (UPF0337 family)